MILDNYHGGKYLKKWGVGLETLEWLLKVAFYF
jgi:hypothetical protein